MDHIAAAASSGEGAANNSNSVAEREMEHGFHFYYLAMMSSLVLFNRRRPLLQIYTCTVVVGRRLVFIYYSTSTANAGVSLRVVDYSVIIIYSERLRTAGGGRQVK